MRQVGTRTKCATTARDDHCTHVVIGIDLVEYLQQLVHHHTRKRIHLVGAMHRDRSDVVAHLVNDFCIHVLGAFTVLRLYVYTSKNREAAMAEPIAPTSAPIARIINITPVK